MLGKLAPGDAVTVTRIDRLSRSTFDLFGIVKRIVEKRVAEYHSPPRTGGTQISIRLDDFVLNHVEAIVQESGWNRAEVMYALIQRGLFDLYYFIMNDPSSSPEIIETIVKRVVAKGAPAQPPVPSE